MNARIFIGIFAIFILTGQMVRGYDSPIFGKWDPPKSLVPFWEGIDPKWWNEPDRKSLVDYCAHYAKTHKSQPLLDDIIEDQKTNPELTRTFVYSWVIINWKDPNVMKRLQQLYKSGTPAEKSIAADFIAEIESSSKNQK